MSIELITGLLFVGLVVGLAAGLPFVFVLGGLALLFAFFLRGPNALYLITAQTYYLMNDLIMVCVPMFIFMANMLQKSGVADDLYEMMYRWLGFLRGGLASGTVLVCTIFAAMSGVSAAAAITMGLIALPSMLKRGYDKSIAVGSIVAGAALGTLIPPSLTFLVIAFFTQVSVGKLFMGGVFPGLLLSSLFITYISIRSAIQPHLGPVLPPGERASWKEKLVSLRGVIAPIFLIVAVLGSIFFGIATPTEASALGAAGSIMIAAIYRRLTLSNFLWASRDTLKLTGMVMWIMIAGTTFAAVYTSIGAADLVTKMLMAMPLGTWGIIVAMQIILFILGCLMDAIAIMMITLPIFIPIIKSLGFDPLWFGVVFMVNMEMGYITPPFGMNLFYLRGVAPKSITMGDMYGSVFPFVLLQMVGLAMVIIFPQIVLWLPGLMIR